MRTMGGEARRAVPDAFGCAAWARASHRRQGPASGAFSHIPGAARVARRSAMGHDKPSTFVGFRLLVDAPAP